MWFGARASHGKIQHILLCISAVGHSASIQWLVASGLAGFFFFLIAKTSDALMGSESIFSNYIFLKLVCLGKHFRKYREAYIKF